MLSNIVSVFNLTFTEKMHKRTFQRRLKRYVDQSIDEAEGSSGTSSDLSATQATQLPSLTAVDVTVPTTLPPIVETPESFLPPADDVSSDDSSDASDEPSLRDDIRAWAQRNNITLTSLSELLKILKPHFQDLPLGGRTLIVGVIWARIINEHRTMA